MALSLRERLAQKKAAVAVPTFTEQAAPVIPTSAESVSTEPTKVVENKPLTFAEKLAMKRAQAAAEQTKVEPKAPTEVRVHINQPDDPEQAQAFSDINRRIQSLTDCFDDDLKNAMAELKQALKENPAASELLLDEDIGKMVTALRRMRQMSVVAATSTKPKKASKPKTKDMQFTKEELEAAWDEL